MRVIRSFFIAVSMYSKIPVPQFEWKEEDMRYTFCFFPWIGALIGVCICLWDCLCDLCGIGILCRVTAEAAIPLLITGGFHVDGFMDTMDALHSYSPRERKLEILKDSHIGAFAVIMLAVYGLVYLGAFSEVDSGAALKIVCAGFFLSRCLSGISAVSFPLAKKEGTLRLFADSSRRKAVKVALYLQGAACVGFMVLQSFRIGLIVTAASLLALAYYDYRCRKEFGGVTGDTAGYFVLLCEACMIAAAAVCSMAKL
ncbi:MAG: adenosylcobinamide-GDP ribazoletransferase [Eubacterium sp.]|nr:adenosylcobinamide-GDP ribazoletransferase [Eubacterium sp.]MCM1214723.1 adenosylcobinamide-GDP ribazoletransferase [Lachnospiraceae bacterium]MCM1239542.1 adenosylcobinamide-GDP ribazoletransferase [Lachnospiraceae bacterium]